MISARKISEESLINCIHLKNQITVHRSGRLSRLARIKKKESGVAEIIGTILIFAIAISLFTTFILWYVPATGTANEQSYYQDTQSSFLGFAEKLSDTQVSQGQSLSYNLPTGINGVPPFSPSHSTSVSFSRNIDNFTASLSYRMVVNYTPQGSVSSTNYTQTFSHTAKGVFKTYAVTQFTTPTFYDLQDGFLVQGQSNQADGIGALPFSANGSFASGYTIGGELLNISGQSTSASSVGSSLAVLYYSNINSTIFKAGQLAAINGTTGRINSISLNYFYYNVTSVYSKQWNYAIFQQYNKTGASFQKVSSLTAWNFNGLPMKVSINGSSISVSLNAQTQFSSVNLVYLNLDLHSI